MRALGVNQFSWASWALVRGLAMSNIIPGHFRSVFEGHQGRPAVQRELGPCQCAQSVNQLSRVTRYRVQWPAVLTSTPV